MKTIPVECFTADIRSVISDVEYRALLVSESRLIVLQLLPETHGKVKGPFPRATFSDKELQDDRYLPQEAVMPGDTVVLYMEACAPNRVVRWRKSPVSGGQFA